MRSTLLPAFLLSLVLLLLPACDSSDDPDDGDVGGGGEVIVGGESSGVFTGDRTGTFNGNAYFAVVENDNFPDGEAFVLIFSDGSVTDIETASEAFLFIRFGNRPEAGTYPIDTTPDEGGVTARYFDFGDQSVNLSLSGQSGTLTLLQSSSDRVTGTFQLAGTGIEPSNPGESLAISVSGEFDAIFVDPSDVDPNFGGF